MSSETPSYDQKARRVKQLLSSYYGLDHDAETNSQQSGGGGPTDDVSSTTSLSTPKFSSIDSPAFNVDTYLTALVRTARVDTLLKKHAEMVKEIRALDSDMQMLVYENYNKFISATDTIRSMKSNVDGMGEKMEELKSLMGRVAQTSDGVNSKLQKHRDGIEELSRVKVLLQKLQCVIDLPKRMGIALREEAFAVAVENYCEARPLLRKYGHQGAFRSVAAECDSVMEQITEKLKNRLCDPKQDAEECVQLLQQLGIETAALQELFLSGRLAQMNALLTEATSVGRAMASEFLTGSPSQEVDVKWLDPESDGVTVASFVKQLSGSVLKLLCESAASFNSTFSAILSHADAPLDRNHLISMSRAVLESYTQNINQVCALAAIQGATQALSLPPQGALSLPWGSDSAEEVPTEFQLEADFGAAAMANCLLSVARDLQMVDSRLPELEPFQAADTLSRTCIEHHTIISFRALVHRVIGTLVHVKKRTLNSQLSSGSILREFGMTDLQRLFAHLCDTLLKTVSAILESLKQYEVDPPLLASWEGAFIDVLQGAIQNLFLALLTAFVALTKPPTQHLSTEEALFKDLDQGTGLYPLSAHADAQRLHELAGVELEQRVEGEEGPQRSRHRTKCPSGVVLLCARLCTFLEVSLVPHVVEKMASMFPGAGSSDQPAFNPSEIIRKSNTTASELLRSYIEIYGSSLAVMIRQSIAAANWLHHKEPRGPRPICDLILTRLEASEKEVVQLIDDGGGRSRRKLTPTPPHNRDPSSASLDVADATEGGTVLERNVAKLFRQRVQLERKAEFTQSSIQSCILGNGLKSLIECIRLETLGRAGLQQLQLDVLYLRPLVTQFVHGKESESIHALLEEVIAAAVERSLDPTLLEPAVVEKILADSNGVS